MTLYGRLQGGDRGGRDERGFRVGAVLPVEPRELLTAFSLDSPELISTFKVYVVLTAGNKRGSNEVVTRPAV